MDSFTPSLSVFLSSHSTACCDFFAQLVSLVLVGMIIKSDESTMQSFIWVHAAVAVRKTNTFVNESINHPRIL
jgi:hypothetical protein